MKDGCLYPAMRKRHPSTLDETVERVQIAFEQSPVKSEEQFKHTQSYYLKIRVKIRKNQWHYKKINKFNFKMVLVLSYYPYSSVNMRI